MRFSLHDRVIFRRHPGAHDEHGHVIGRTLGRVAIYTIETADGERVENPHEVRLDEEWAEEIRASELGPILGVVA